MEIFYNVVFTLLISVLLAIAVVGTFYALVGIMCEIVEMVQRKNLFNNSKKSKKNG